MDHVVLNKIYVRTYVYFISDNMPHQRFATSTTENGLAQVWRYTPHRVPFLLKILEITAKYICYFAGRTETFAYT